MCDPENVGQDHEYNMCNDGIRWQISTSKKIILHIFVLALAISEIFTFQMFDLENLSQGHGVQHSLLPHSMANT